MDETNNDLPELPTLKQAINELAELREVQEQLYALAVSKLRPDTHPTLLVVMAALKRSHALTQGFLLLVDARNEFAASPLVRMQLDSVLRLSAFRVLDKDKQEDLILHILKGEEPYKFDKRFSDSKLRESLARTYSEIDSLYKRSSGYIHFSRDHIIRSMVGWKKRGMSIEDVRYGPLDEMPDWDDQEWRSCIFEFCLVTHYLTEEVIELLGIPEEELGVDLNVFPDD